jgi:hypothetical protein
MPERSKVACARPPHLTGTTDAPPPEVAEFIKYCHRRRHAVWPELYDEMCAVAARREFNGWDHDQLAARGLTFSLFEMPRLAGWVRAVVGAAPDVPEAAVIGSHAT